MIARAFSDWDSLLYGLSFPKYTHTLTRYAHRDFLFINDISFRHHFALSTVLRPWLKANRAPALRVSGSQRLSSSITRASSLTNLPGKGLTERAWTKAQTPMRVEKRGRERAEERHQPEEWIVIHLKNRIEKALWTSQNLSDLCFYWFHPLFSICLCERKLWSLIALKTSFTLKIDEGKV